MHQSPLRVLVVVMCALSAIALSAIAPSTLPAGASSGPAPYFQVELMTLPDGRQIERNVIGGPPQPPPGAARPVLALGALAEGALAERALAEGALAERALPAASKLLPVPTYEWTFGCSATSGAMIAAYYDRGAYPALYTGPTDGGVMPADSSVWGYWTDANGALYAQCPLAASRAGLDERGGRGSLDDYWVKYGSTSQDPFLTNNWTQHAWGDAIGDYMKTSQSSQGNSDGATSFHIYTSSASQLTCNDMVNYGIATKDGTYGRKLFYEAKGFTVTECYNQSTDNQVSGGFSFAKYKAEINAGRPVMLNLVGHTVVGVGYDDAGSTVYLNDTWDRQAHTMTWGGSYGTMAMQSVSIVNLACPAAETVSELEIEPAGSTDVDVTWTAVAGADHYEIWSAANKPYFTPGANCASPAPYSCQAVTGTSLTTAGLGSTANNTTYAARVVNACGATSGVSTARVGEFEFGLVRP